MYKKWLFVSTYAHAVYKVSEFLVLNTVKGRVNGFGY